MKTNIKFFWCVNAITLIILGTLYIHLTYGIFGSLFSTTLSWENIRTIGPYIAVIALDITILFFGILPFAEALYEETTNHNIHSLNKYDKLFKNIEQAPTSHIEFKQTISFLIQNHTELAYQIPTQNMMNKFGESSPEIIALYIDRMAKDPSSISLAKRLVSLSDNQLKAYGMFSRLGKPNSLKKMSELSMTIEQFNLIINNAMVSKQADDTNTLLETVGA